MRRTGIDLSPTHCHLVDAESSGRRQRDEPCTLRIRHFAELPRGDAEFLTAELRALLEDKSFPRHTWVNVWDIRSSHQYRLFPSVSESALDWMVRRHAASTLERNDADVTVAATFGETRTEQGRPPKREVSFFAAGSRDVTEKLQPLIAAGFVIDGVTTPCGALWAQAKLRRPLRPDEVHAYVALGRSQSALGIFSDGAMLYGRDLDWGFASTVAGDPVSLDRELFAARLAQELRQSFLYLTQFWDEDVSQVVLCGDMPELRSLTAPLIERLNIEVETLDTLEGIDANTLPAGFAERAAAFRLAAAVAVEPPPANLLPVAMRGERQPSSLVKGALALAASLAVVALLYGLAVRQRGERITPPPAPHAALADQKTPVVIDSRPASPPEASPEPALSEPLAALPPRQALPTPGAVPVPRPELRGILVSDGRRFALINGRIVSVGDRVGSAIVRTIEADAVVLDMPDGQTRLEIVRPTIPMARP